MHDKEAGDAVVNGARLAYEVVGEGELLVLVHAGIADMRMWAPQVGPFSEYRRVVRYDMRGFGKSPMVAGPFSHHEDLCGLLDSLGVGRASFVGCSMGGKTVIDFALENPGRVEALVLLGAPVGGFDPDTEPPKEWEEMVAADEIGDLEHLSELEVQVWVDGPHREPDVVDPAVRDLVHEMNLIALRNEASGLGDERPLEPPAVGRLDEIQAPTLVIVGDLDHPEILAAADLLTREVPRAEKAIMHGTAHLPNIERPEEFNTLVIEFLERSR